MEKVRPIYKKLLVAAIAAYIIGMTFILVDITIRLGAVEHMVACMTFAGQHKH